MEQCVFYRIDRLRFTREITMRVVLAIFAVFVVAANAPGDSRTPALSNSSTDAVPQPLITSPRLRGEVAEERAAFEAGEGSSSLVHSQGVGIRVAPLTRRFAARSSDLSPKRGEVELIGTPNCASISTEHGPHAPGDSRPPARQPNVLFIAIDDLNDWVGFLGGHPQVKTPHMDRLAARGTAFTNAHCQAPLCNPSRTSLLTGLRPTTTGVYALAPWFRTAKKFEQTETIFQYFHKHGYITISGGKIFHGGYPPKERRAAEVDTWGQRGAILSRPKTKFVQTPDPIAAMDWGVFPEKDEDCFDYDVATWAAQQLRTPPKAPFFLAVGFQHPHVPCFAPQKWFDLYPDATLKLPPVKDDDRDDLPRFASYLHWKLPEPRLKWLRDANQWRPLVRAYLASVSFVDAQVGRVLDALDAAKLTDNTIVVLWGDHGWHLGEKGITGKNTLWERSTHVPLVFAGPGIARAARCGRPAELLDLYPTLAEACGLPKKDGLEGLSLVPQLKDAKAARERPAVTTHNPGNHAVRTEQWRYIRYADGSEELYDVIADPNEWTNRAAELKLTDIKTRLAKWMPATSAAPLPGSAGRILTYENGVPIWEGKPIGTSDPFPDR